MIAPYSEFRGNKNILFDKKKKITLKIKIKCFKSGCSAKKKLIFLRILIENSLKSQNK